MVQKETFSGCLHAYEKAYQLAGLIRQFYNNAIVITNDIGTASFISDWKQTHLVTGICYMEIARSREGSYLCVEYAYYEVVPQETHLSMDAFGSGFVPILKSEYRCMNLHCP
jgi:hypothetical protein